MAPLADHKTNASTRTRAAWQWTVGIFVTGFAVLVTWVYFAYPEYARRAREAELRMPEPTAEDMRLKALHQPRNLTFSASPCSEKFAPPSETDSGLGIRESQWIDDRTFRVKARISENCGVYFPFARYAASGQLLNLEYAVGFPGGPAAACLCAYDLDFTIAELERNEYRLDVKKGEFSK